MKKASVAKLIGGLAWLLMLVAGNLTPVSAQENAPARVLTTFSVPTILASAASNPGPKDPG